MDFLSNFHLVMLAIIGGIISIAIFLRPQLGIPLLVIALPLESSNFSIKTPIQELGPTEMVFYPVLAGYIVQLIVNKKLKSLQISPLAILFAGVGFFSLFAMPESSMANLTYLLAFINVVVFSVVVRDIVADNYALIQTLKLHVIMGAIYVLVEFLYYTGGWHRMGYLTSSPNQFAHYLLSIAFIAIAFMSFRGGLKRSFVFMAAAILAFGGIALTASRAAAVSAALGLMVYLALVKGSRNRKVLYFSIACICVTVLLMVIMSFDKDQFDVVFMKRFSGEFDDTSVIRRQLLLDEGLRLFWVHPLLGNGPGSFHMLSQLIYAGEVPLTHNSYLDILVSYGIVGLCLFVALLTGIGLLLTALPVGDSVYSALRPGLLAAYSAMSFHLLFFNGGFAHQFWFIVASVGVLPRVMAYDSSARLLPDCLLMHRRRRIGTSVMIRAQMQQRGR